MSRGAAKAQVVNPDQVEIDRFRNVFELTDGFAFHVIVTPTLDRYLAALAQLPERLSCYLL